MRSLVVSLVLCCVLFCGVVVSQPSLTVLTQNGYVQGAALPTARQWLGVPFAEPPINKLRWQRPQPPSDWSGVLNTTSFRAGCIQHCKEPPGACPIFTSEDCLYLNIYAPLEQGDGLLPVYVFFPGGNYVQSGPTTLLLEGQFFSNVSGMIIVTVAYRLGVLGFLSTSDGVFNGSYALYDQWAALDWVQNNIRAFGGNNQQVTIAGQSAGAISNWVHLVSPAIKNKNYFQRVVIESGTLGIPFRDIKQTNDLGKVFADTLGCKLGDLTCFLSKSSQDVLDAQVTTQHNIVPWPNTFEKGYTWSPAVGTPELPSQPLDMVEAGEHQNVPVFVGTCRDEGVQFVMELFPKPVDKIDFYGIMFAVFGDAAVKIIENYPVPVNESSDARLVLANITTDKVFACSTRRAARIMAQTNPVYMYYFDHPLSFPGWGPNFTFCEGFVCHGSELVFLYDVAPLMNYTMTAAEDVLTSQMQKLWGAFVAGEGDHYSLQNWPSYNETSNLSIRLNTGSFEVQANRNAIICDIWDSIGYGAVRNEKGNLFI
eukprot:TRINITY_DN441_c0_g1_i1.p1 TRINITY_DN441_c0_g1~~TRINITY_DN441_c0_g1_i1.p1  ORF type:complete len:539 (-),score=129.61 TRINITY_DN441_c0_g1_i1:87-1703(-)